MGGKNANISGTEGENDLFQFMMENLSLKEKSPKELIGTCNNQEFSYLFQKRMTFEDDFYAFADMFTSWLAMNEDIVNLVLEKKAQRVSGSAIEKLYKYLYWLAIGWLDIIIVLTNDENTFMEKFKKHFKNDKLNGRIMLVHKKDWGRLFKTIEKCREERMTTLQVIEEFKKFNSETPEHRPQPPKKKEVTKISPKKIEDEPKNTSPPKKVVEEQPNKTPTKSTPKTAAAPAKTAPKKQNKTLVQKVDADENDENVTPAV